MNTVTSPDGTTISYDQSGEGPPLILVGAAFNDRQTTAPLATALAPHFTAVSYDRRGRGDSTDTAPYAVEREVEDLGSVVGALGGSAFVFGHSSGAALALEAAASGLTFTGLAVFEPPYRIGDSPRPPADFETELSRLIAAGRRGDTVEFFMTAAVGVPADAVAGMRQAPMWPALEAISHTLRYDAMIMGAGDPPAGQLAAIKVPTLAIASAGSPDWLQRGAKAVADTVPGAQHRILDGGFHEIPPELVVPVLQSFFTS
jgi:pimeloyl-ACP methyl ester carboxylesterase